MRAYPFTKFLRFAAILIAGSTLTQGTLAAASAVNSGHVRYTIGTAEAIPGRERPAPPVEQDPVLSQAIRQWQIASADAPVLSGQASMIATKPATFELPTVATFAVEALPAATGAVVISADAIKSGEPGFWAPAASTLALALFFFLRRLA